MPETGFRRYQTREIVKRAGKKYQVLEKIASAETGQITKKPNTPLSVLLVALTAREY